jgi:hypothetical protein
MLANQQAKTIAEPRLPVAMAITISVGRSALLIARFESVRSGSPTEFLDGAEPDTVSLAKSAVDGSGLSDAHLGAVDHGRDVGGIGVSVADETARTR